MHHLFFFASTGFTKHTDGKAIPQIIALDFTHRKKGRMSRNSI